MKNIVTITLETLLTIIEGIRPSSFVSIVQVTPPSNLKKRDAKAMGFNPNEIIKVTALNTHSGISYENKKLKVTGEGLVREPFYNIISDNKMLAENKKNPAQKYFLYSGFQNSNPRSKFVVSGKLMSKLPEGLLRKSDFQPVVWRTVKVENIRRMTVDGTTYKVEG